MLDQLQTVDAGLHLNVLVPERQVEHGLKLLGAELNWLSLVLEERAVIAVVAHILMLLLKVKLVGDNL